MKVSVMARKATRATGRERDNTRGKVLPVPDHPILLSKYIRQVANLAIKLRLTGKLMSKFPSLFYSVNN